MTIIASERPPVEVPKGIDHYEFFAALLDSARHAEGDAAAGRATEGG